MFNTDDVKRRFGSHQQGEDPTEFGSRERFKSYEYV